MNFYLDGKLAGSSNQYPNCWVWDTKEVSNGLHSLEIETVHDPDSPPEVERRTVLVKN